MRLGLRIKRGIGFCYSRFTTQLVIDSLPLPGLRQSTDH